MYFDSRIVGKKGMPWIDSRTKWEKSSDSYYEKLEELAEQIDDVESSTSFFSELSPDDFDNGYQYILSRLKELKEYLIHDTINDDKDELIESLNEIYNDLEDLRDDAILYDDFFNDEDEDYDDFEDEDLDDIFESDWDLDDDGIDDDIDD